MPRNRPGRRRRRRGGEQASENATPQQEQTEHAAADATTSDSAASREEDGQREQSGRPRRLRRRGRGRRTDSTQQDGSVSPEPRRDRDQQPQGRQGSGRSSRRSQRRRPQRQQQIFGPSQLEVLKDGPRRRMPEPGMTKRTVEDLSDENGTRAGCPMLTRTKLGLPIAEGRQVPRCSLGWALHAEDEAMNCMLTPKVIDCWKSSPEAYRQLMERRGKAAAD